MIKPILWKVKELRLATSSYIKLDSSSSTSFKLDKRIETKYDRIKRFRHKRIKLEETNPQLLVQHLKNFKSAHFRKTLDINITLTLVWSNRQQIFFILSQAIRRFSALRKLGITIDFCLDLRMINFLLSKIKSQKHLVNLNIDLSKFYRISPAFLKNLIRLIRCQTNLESLNFALRKTPEQSFNDDLFPLFQAFQRLHYLKHLAFSYFESIQFKKFDQIDMPRKILSTLHKMSLTSLALVLKSNSFSQQLLAELPRVITSIKSLTRLDLSIADTENLNDAHFTSCLLEELNKRSSKITSINLNNTLNGAGPKTIEALYLQTFKFLTTHPKVQQLNMKFTAPSFFNGMKLASTLVSLKSLKSLTLRLDNSNDLILLQEIGKLTWLTSLNIIIEYELDTQISGLLESLGNLISLQHLKLESKKSINEMYFQRQDFWSLVNSLTKLKLLKSLTLWLPLKPGNSFEVQISRQELDLITNYLLQAEGLENFVLKGTWNALQKNELIALYKAFFINLQTVNNFEFHICRLNSPIINFSEIFLSLQYKYRNQLVKRQKKDSQFRLSIHDDDL